MLETNTLLTDGKQIANGEIEKELEKELEKDIEKREKKKKFVPPTLEEVKAYIADNGYHVDAEFFWNYYDKGHWKRKDGTPVISWKQTLVTWEKKDAEKPQQQKQKKYVTAAEYKPPETKSADDVWKLVDKI